MTKPNILIYMTDHQRGDTVLPEHRAFTPNVDRLASEGITFAQTFCPSPHCCPARATFWTGLYPSRHGVWNNICNDQALSRGLKEGIKLWSDDLLAAGYQLHWSGKWHVSVQESPADRGWHQYYCTGDRHSYHGQHWSRYKEMAKEPDATQRGEAEILRPGYGTYRLYGIREEGSPHDETAVEHGLKVLESVKGSDQPWCLFVGAIGPHDPYFVPELYLDMYDPSEIELPPSYLDSLADKPVIYGRMRGMRFGQLTPDEVREAIRHFWAYCTYLDELFGRLLDGLEATGQADNTIVLYTSDHGDYCGDHGLFAKGIPCFRGAYHVPAVMRWPGHVVDPGSRVEEFVSLADFGPTFIEAAGLPLDRSFSGASLLPFLAGEAPPTWRDEIHTQCNGVELYYTQRSVTTANWKYTFNGFDRDELYDLRNDPHEMRNLAQDPAYAQVVREMCGRMWRFAHAEDDAAINGYITVGLAPYGPAEAFR